jgi:copper chaperone CopZ
MSELTIMIYDSGHKELKAYLMSLKGILDVVIENEKQLKIYIKYNPDLITLKVIKMEILLFLNLLNLPSIIAFDKHSTIKNSVYKIIRDDICCEYCLNGSIEELFDMEGIEKVESNFYEKEYGEKGTVVINIKYNPDLISNDDMKQIELKLNI